MVQSQTQVEQCVEPDPVDGLLDVLFLAQLRQHG